MIDWAGSSRQTCPDCARGPKDRTLGMTIDERGGVAHCFRCGYRETDAGAKHHGRPVEARSAPIRHETLSDYGVELWGACRAIRDE